MPDRVECTPAPYSVSGPLGTNRSPPDPRSRRVGRLPRLPRNLLGLLHRAALQRRPPDLRPPLPRASPGVLPPLAPPARGRDARRSSGPRSPTCGTWRASSPPSAGSTRSRPSLPPTRRSRSLRARQALELSHIADEIEAGARSEGLSHGRASLRPLPGSAATSPSSSPWG